LGLHAKNERLVILHRAVDMRRPLGYWVELALRYLEERVLISLDGWLQSEAANTWVWIKMIFGIERELLVGSI